MQCEVDRKELLAPVKTCQAVANGRVRPIWGCVRLEFSEVACQLQATDGRRAIQVSVPIAGSGQTGIGCVTCDLLASILSVPSGDKATLLLDAELTVTTANSRHRLPLQDANGFASLPAAAKPLAAAVGSVLANAIGRAVYACDDTYSSYTLGGVLFDFSPSGWALVATNGRQLSLNAAERSLADLVQDAIAGRSDGIVRKCECGGELTVKSSWQVCDSQKQRCRCDKCGETIYRSVPRSTIRARNEFVCVVSKSRRRRPFHVYDPKQENTMPDKLRKYVCSREQYETLVCMSMGNVGIPPHLHAAVIQRAYPQRSIDTLAELSMRGFAAEPIDLMLFAERNNLRTMDGQPMFTQNDVDKLAAELLAKRQFTPSTKAAIKARVAIEMRLERAAQAVAEHIAREADCGDRS